MFFLVLILARIFIGFGCRKLISRGETLKKEDTGTVIAISVWRPSLFSSWASADSLIIRLPPEAGHSLPQPLPSNLRRETAAGKVLLTVQSFYFMKKSTLYRCLV